MADQIDPTGTSPLHLFAPPTGRFADYEFTDGFVVTHNANTADIADFLAPVLFGIATTDRRRRLLECRAAGENSRLVVYAAADAIEYSGPELPFLDVVGIAGRRLHAKFGVLKFTRPSGASITRAFITSANLTRGGLVNNHEFVVFDDASSKPATHLVFDLLDALRALRRDLAPANKKTMTSVARSIRSGLNPNGKPTRNVVHSLDAPRDLTAKWRDRVQRKHKAVEKMTIVSPGFASNSDRLAIGGLDDLLAVTDEVRVVTSSRQGSPVLSTGVERKLRRFSPTIEIPREPESAVDRRRTLHAKGLIATSGGVSCMLVGSANFTTPGLSGRNRELVYLTEVPGDQADALVAGLDSEVAQVPPVQPDKREPSTDVDPQPDVFATFEVAEGERAMNRRWNGTLHLEYDRKPKVLQYLGKAIRVKPEQPLELDSDHPVLVVTVGNSKPFGVPIDVRPPTSRADFWSDIDTGEAEDPDDYLLRLLTGDLRSAVSVARSAEASPQIDDKATVVEDRYWIPLEQRLVQVVRASRDRQNPIAEGISEAELRLALINYLAEEGDAAIDVALTILLRKAPEGSPRVLSALGSALDSFDREE